MNERVFLRHSLSRQITVPDIICTILNLSCIERVFRFFSWRESGNPSKIKIGSGLFGQQYFGARLVLQ